MGSCFICGRQRVDVARYRMILSCSFTTSFWISDDLSCSCPIFSVDLNRVAFNFSTIFDSARVISEGSIPGTPVLLCFYDGVATPVEVSCPISLWDSIIKGTFSDVNKLQLCNSMTDTFSWYFKNKCVWQFVSKTHVLFYTKDTASSDDVDSLWSITYFAAGMSVWRDKPCPIYPTLKTPLGGDAELNLYGHSSGIFLSGLSDTSLGFAELAKRNSFILISRLWSMWNILLFVWRI